MTKRIKHISELPNWFKLEKYTGTIELDAAGWYEQLSVRKNCLFVYVKYLKKQNLEELLTLIRENPIVDTLSDKILEAYFFGGELTELKPKKPHYSLGVYPLTVRSICLITSPALTEKIEYLRKWQESFKKSNFSENTYTYQSWIDESIYHSSCTTPHADAVYVDLKLPDNVLIEHFKLYLKSRRAENKNIIETPKPNRRSDFNNWIRLGVLPYLDLKIWETEEDLSIPNRVMADAIFPHGENGEETIRKTTEPLAMSLLSEESLNRLSAHAALEIAEENII